MIFKNKVFINISCRPGKMAQWVMLFVNKHEYVSWIPKLGNHIVEDSQLIQAAL